MEGVGRVAGPCGGGGREGRGGVEGAVVTLASVWVRPGDAIVHKRYTNAGLPLMTVGSA